MALVVDKERISSVEAAKQLGCSPRTVLRHATDLGVGIRPARDWLFTPEEIAAIRARIQPGPGNPDFRRQSKESED